MSLSTQTPTAAMLHVLTFRHGVSAALADAVRHLTSLTLNHLETGTRVETVITRLAGGKTVPAEVVEHIITARPMGCRYLWQN